MLLNLFHYYKPLKKQNTMSDDLEIVSADSLSLITKAEIDVQISTAKAYPRSVQKSIQKAISLATTNEHVAESCGYAIPRGGKTIEGPSVRLAEIVAASFGNLRSGARVIANDGKTVTAQGICHDLETNNAVTVEVKRKITDKNGNKFSEDMQVVTGNAACAIAYRNAIFKVIPAALIDSVYVEVKKVARGTSKTLEVRRKAAVSYFNGLGVKNTKICEVLGVKKIGDIDLDALEKLTGFKTAIKGGDSTKEEIFEVKSAADIVAEKKAALASKSGKDSVSSDDTQQNTMP